MLEALCMELGLCYGEFLGELGDKGGLLVGVVL